MQWLESSGLFLDPGHKWSVCVVNFLPKLDLGSLYVLCAQQSDTGALGRLANGLKTNTGHVGVCRVDNGHDNFTSTVYAV